jgi:hypothetical protein
MQGTSGPVAGRSSKKPQNFEDSPSILDIQDSIFCGSKKDA